MSEKGFEASQRVEEKSIVLLKNSPTVLPINPSKVHSIAIIGGHADVGMISGGGSAQVDPPGGNAIMPPGKGATIWQKPVWFPRRLSKTSAPRAASAKVEYDAGTDPASAAALAKRSDVALVFVSRWETEGADSDSLSLSGNQDDLIAKVAVANPHTIVVLETGDPVSMPWSDHVSAILEAWFPGSRGAEALANVLFGDVNPSGKLPITFPRTEADLPHPTLVKPPREASPESGADGWKKAQDGLPVFQTNYDEGLKIGYKWYDAENKLVLFPFGYGLSYTTYAYANLRVTSGEKVVLSFTVKNTGKRAGAEIAQVYATLPASAEEPPKRLVGWSKVKLNPGESREVTVEVDPLFLSIYDVAQNAWQRVAGEYTFLVGGSSQSLPMRVTRELK